MLTVSQAAILGALQGLTELFPISSLGHSVLLPSILGWSVDQSSPYFLPFLVLTHLATALVLLCFFWKDWTRIISGIFRSLKERQIRNEDTYARLGWLLIVGSIPAGILGVLFSQELQQLFAAPKPVAAFLLFNGVLLFGAEMLRRKKKDQPEEDKDANIADLSWWEAIKIGFMQCLALLPGFSRTGATLGGGLLVGLSHEEAARFSFLLATPIIFAASALEIPTLFVGNTTNVLVPAFVGAACAAVAAYLSVRFLVSYFKTNTLLPFAAYCFVVGALCLFFL